MNDIRKLLDSFAAQEEQLRSTQFLAPCVRGGRIRTRVAGMVYTFTPKPRKFEGWGIFEPVDQQTAAMVVEAELPQVAEYLRQFKPFRLRLAYVLQGKTWLAYPVNEADMRQRVGSVKPVPVQLVTEGTSFEQIVARWDGQSWWLEELDRHADPLVVEELRSALRQLISPLEVRFKGITPEMRSLYDLVTQQTEGFSQHHRDERRLQKALKMGGGELREFRDRGDYWTVEWKTADGQQHTSAIAKTDLTVIGAGICLSGRDRDFDLQSLVGVIEDR